MIKIFNPTDTNFSSCGNIIINPTKCIETRKKSLNGWYIDVEVPIKYSQYLEQDMLCVIKSKSKVNPQAFRIKNIERKQRKIVFQARHVMFDAEDYFLLDVRPTDKNGQNVLSYVNERTDKTSPFTVYSNVATQNTAYFIRKNMLEAWETIEERWGGAFDADNWNVSLLSQVGNDNGETIMYGKNLQGINVFEDWSNVVTKLYPVGYDGIMLPEVYLESDVQYDEPYTKTIDFETNLEDDDLTEANLITELRTNATAYLNENKVPKISYTIDVNVNETLMMGDTVHIKHPLCNISAEVLEYEYNVISEKTKSITVGNYSRDVKNKFNAIKENVNEIAKKVSNQEVVIAEQTEMINSLNKNGYVYIDDNEILILDALPKSSARNVWRFGLGGIGFSSNGYEGPFGIAMTMDGQINADFITTGTMNVSRINGLSSELNNLRTAIELNENNISLVVSDISDLQEEAISSVDVKYALGTSTTTAPTTGWSTTAPQWQQGKYMWQRTDITYANGTTETGTPTCIAGAKGETGSGGVGISSVTEYYAVSTSNSTAPADSSFVTSPIPSMTTTNKYLWNYEVITYTNNSTERTAKRVIGVYGNTGQNGADGDDGKGISSIVNKYAVSTSNTTAPTTWYNSPQNMTSTNKYLWNYEIITYTDNTTFSSTPAVIGVYGDKGERGLQGLQGERGEQGIPGTNGTNGQTSYFHIKYSAVANPTSSSQMSETPNNYIGTYVDFTQADSTNPSDYTWSQFKGSQGEQGIPGTNGTDGQTYYLHIKYSDDGGTTFTSNTGETPGAYIGVLTNTTQADSTRPADYTWSQILGDEGIGVSEVIEQYYLSTSNTTQTGGSWKTTQDAWQVGKYIWTRSKITWTDNTVTYTTPVLAEAINNANSVATNANDKVDNMEIGGTQLLRGTNTVTSLTSNGTWTNGTWRSASGGTGTRTSIDISNSPNANIKRGWSLMQTNGAVDICQDKVPVMTGIQYTMSCYAKGTGKLTLQYGNNPWPNKNFTLNNVTEWTRYVFTFTISEVSDGVTTAGCNIYFGNRDAGTIQICGMKLEKGNMATDWTESPEDLPTKVEMNSAITQKANEINLTVATKVGKNEIISQINQTSEQITIDASKLGLTASNVIDIISGNTLNLTSKSIAISSTNFSVDVNGNITANSGTIGGINMSSGGLYYLGTNSDDGFGLWKANQAWLHVTNPLGQNDYIIFHSGDNGGNIALAPFRIYQSGAFCATKGQIGDFSIINGSLYVRRYDGLESEISEDGFHIWETFTVAGASVKYNLIDISVDDISSTSRTKITNTEISSPSFRNSNAGYLAFGRGTSHTYSVNWTGSYVQAYVDDIYVGTVGMANNGYAPFTGDIPIINSITSNGDGTVSWTYSNLHVSNGVITGYSA